MKIRNNLKYILKEQGISQAELARAIGTTSGSISNIVNERFLPSMDVAFDIAQILNMPIDRIFYKIDNVAFVDYCESIDKMEAFKEYYEYGFIKEDTMKTACKDVYDNFVEKHSDEEFKNNLNTYTKNIDRKLYDFLKKNIIQ